MGRSSMSTDQSRRYRSSSDFDFTKLKLTAQVKTGKCKFSMHVHRKFALEIFLGWRCSRTDLSGGRLRRDLFDFAQVEFAGAEVRQGVHMDKLVGARLP